MKYTLVGILKLRCVFLHRKYIIVKTAKHQNIMCMKLLIEK